MEPPPNDLLDPAVAYNPGIWILIYACPPTPGMDILLDPCFLGVSPFTDDFGNMTDINDLLIINLFPPGTFTDNTVYYVPITMYDVTTGIYSLYPPPDLCFDLGAIIPVTYLPPIVATGVPDCATGTVVVTVSGGHPEIFGTNFTASALLPATAAFVNTTCANGGTITISGLVNGDNYSFDITDINGCPHTFTGGPFVGPTNPIINPAGPFCATDPAVNLTATLGGGTWTATCGACITAGGNFNPATAGIGTFTVTYTIPGCSNPDTALITVADLTITSIVTSPNSCFGSTDGTITITAPGATLFSSDNGLTFQASNVFTVGAGTYNIVVQSPGGCTDNGTATIVSPTAVTAIPGGQDESCFGACDGFAVVAPGGGTGTYSFSWTGPATGTSALLSSICSGLYTITVTDGNGCTATATQTINGAIAVTITSTPVINVLCNGGATGSITVNATGTGALNYSINGGAFQVSNIFGGLAAGTYTIVAQDANGCTATINVVVNQPTPVTVVAGPDVTICIGASTNLTAIGAGGTGPYNYTWTNNVDATVLIGANQTVFPTANTIYTVVVTDANGCGPVNDQIIVTINPPLGVTANLTQSICPGTPITLIASGSGGNGIYTYTWTNNIDATVFVGANYPVSPLVTTVYTVTITDNCGTPLATDVVTITVYPLPAISYGPYTINGCAPLSVTFTNLTVGVAAATCFWDFGDGSTSTNCNPTYVYTVAGCFDVSLNMVTSDGCAIDTTVFSNVCVFPIPIADFTAGPQPTDIFATEVNFTNLTIGGNTYTWDFGGLGTSTQTNPTFIFPDAAGGIYSVCLTTVSSNGCIDATCQNIIIDDVFLIYVPNTFTPEGDGTNDIFIPIIQGEDPETYELMIFNRWGELIFQSNNKLVGWDGTHKSIKSKEDVYVWKLRVRKKQNQEKVEYIGHVTLLR